MLPQDPYSSELLLTATYVPGPFLSALHKEFNPQL